MMSLDILHVEYLPAEQVKNYNRRLRIPSKKQIEKTVRLIKELAFIPPIVIDKDNTVIIGEYLAAAAIEAGLQEIPVIRVTHLNEEQIRVLRIAYDRIAEEAEWDKNALKLEFEELQILIPEIDLTLSPLRVREFLDSRDGLTNKKRAERYKMYSILAGHVNMNSTLMLQPKGTNLIITGPFLDPTTLKATLDEMGQFAIEVGELLSEFFPSDWAEGANLLKDFKIIKYLWISEFYPSLNKSK